MAKIIVRDGKEYFFKDDDTEETINKFFETQQEIKENPQETKTEEATKEVTEDDSDRGILTDVPYSGLVGVNDAGKETLNLAEGIAQSIKKKLGYGGLTFGKNADNGFVQYHSYEDAIKNNIKFPLSGDITKTGDNLFTQSLPEMDTPDTTAGHFTKGISQWLTGYYTGGRLLKPIKATTKSGQLAKVMAKGAIADFQVFGQETGRFADIVNTHAPILQNPLFDYLGSEGKDEGFYEARLKNAVEGLFLGGVVETAFRGFRSETFMDTVKYIKTVHKRLGGEKINSTKLKEIEENLLKSAEEEILPIGKIDRKKLKESIKQEAGLPFKNKKGEIVTDDIQRAKTEKTITKLKEITSAEELNNKLVDNFDKFIEKIRTNKKGVKYQNIDEHFDFGLSPRAYADGNFGIIALEAMTKIIRSEKKFDKMSDALIEKQALKSGGDIIQTTKMLGNLGDKLEGGLKYMWASQSLQMNLADTLYKMANSLRKNDGVYKENDMKMVTAITMKLLRFDEKVTSNLGRGLRLRSVLKDANVDMNQDSILNMVRNFEKFDGNFKDFVEGVALTRDKNALIKTVDFLFKNNMWNKINEVWMSMALSNIKTQAVNVISTGINTMVKPMDSWVGSKLSWGLDTQTRKMVQAEGKVAIQTLAGLKTYLDEALLFAKKAFNDEDSILFAGSTKLDGQTKALGNSSVARAVRIPLRALTGMDELFKQINYKSKLMAIAVREADNLPKKLSKNKIVGTLPNGTKVSEYDYWIAQRYKKGFDESGVIGIDKEAKRYSQEATFTKDLTGVLAKIQEAVQEAPILKQVLPFIKTPANLAIQAIERTPFGIMGKNWKNFTGASKDAVRIAETRGRFAIGSSILVASSILALNGRITGGGHPDKAIRNIQKQEGIQPYSIKIGDSYFEYGRLDPIGMLIGTVADYVEIYNDLNEDDRMKIENNLMAHLLDAMDGDGVDNLGMDEKISNMAVAGYKSIFKNIGSKTYLRSLIEFTTAINGEDVDKRGSWWMQNKASSFWPNIFGKLGNQDPNLREANTLIESFKRKIGLGLEKDLLKTYNYLGEPIKYTGNSALRLFNGLVNPITYGKQKNDFVLQKTIEHEINIPPISKVKGGVDLTKFVNEDGLTAYEYYNNLIAKSPLRKNLTSLMKSKAFIDAPDEIVIDPNNKNFGGKKAMVIDKVKMWRDIEFNKVKYNSQFKSIENDKITIGNAYVNRDLIKTIGTSTNKYPKNLKKGIYDFIETNR